MKNVRLAARAEAAVWPDPGEPVYRVAKEKIKAAPTAGVLARKLKEGKR